MKGSYVLVIENKEDQAIQVGRLGEVFFEKGFYVYIGSALNGLEVRIGRHKRTDKKFHWHIDYLLEKTKIVNVFCKESNVKDECRIAGFFKNLDYVKGFGCSDCKCDSHLFYGDYSDILELCETGDFSQF